MSAYLITTGCYSDYQVLRVFLDEQEANDYVRPHNEWLAQDLRSEDDELSEYDEWRVEEVPFRHEEARDQSNWWAGPGFSAQWDSTWAEDGYVKGGWTITRIWLEDPAPAKVAQRNFYTGINKWDRSRASVCVQGTDEQKVLKVLYDEIMTLKARLEGVA